MNIVYRKARVEDYEGIYYVSCYSWDETYRGFMPDDYLDDRINIFFNNSRILSIEINCFISS